MSFTVEDRTLKRHKSIGVFVVYIDTGSSMPICSDVKTRKRRNVVGIDMIRNNRIVLLYMLYSHVYICVYLLPIVLLYILLSHLYLNLCIFWDLDITILKNVILPIGQGLKNRLVRGPGLAICGFGPNIF